jgi:hypothetical protein
VLLQNEDHDNNLNTLQIQLEIPVENNKKKFGI